MLYVGVDHHKRYRQLAAVDERGELVKEGRVQTDRDELSLFLRGVRPALYGDPAGRAQLGAFGQAFGAAYGLASDQLVRATQPLCFISQIYFGLHFPTLTAELNFGINKRQIGRLRESLDRAGLLT